MSENQIEANPAFMRPPQAAAYLGISPRHLFDLSKAGVIPACRVSKKCTLYSRRELEAAVLSFSSGKVRRAC